MKRDSYLLDNGLQVVLAEIPGCSSLCIHAAVRSGVIYESARSNGVSHLLEHLHALQAMGDGSSTSSSSSSGSDVLRTCASFDAWLELDSSHYSITTTEEHAISACQQLIFGLSELSIPNEHFEQEKRIVAVEVEPAKGRDFLSAIYERVFSGTPYGMANGGRKKTVMRLARCTLDEYDRQFYDPRSIAVGIAGKFRSHTINKMLSALSSLPASAEWMPHNHPICAPRRGQISCWGTASRECALAFSIPPTASYDDVLCLRVIAAGLGLNSSPLFKELRTGSPCYYDFDARIDYPGEWCMFILRCEAEWSRQSSAILGMAKALASITAYSKKSQMDEWLEESRRIFLHLADVGVLPIAGRAYQIALPHVASSRKRYSELEREVDTVRAVSVDKLKSVVKNYLRVSCLSVIYDGPRFPGQPRLLYRGVRRVLGKQMG